MNNGFPVRNEFKFSGFIVKVYFLVIILNAFSSHIKKNLNNTIKIVENSVIYLFFKPSATHARSNRKRLRRACSAISKQPSPRS